MVTSEQQSTRAAADLNDLYTRKAAEQEAVAAILAAIDSEDLDAVRTAAAENRKALVAGAADYESRHLPLHLAASRGLTAVMEILLEAGASAEARDGFGNTALQVRCENSAYLIPVEFYLCLVTVEFYLCLHCAARTQPGRTQPV